MNNEIENVLKIRKWEWIPIFGPIIYAVRVEWFRTKMENARLRKDFGHYRTIYNLASLAVAIVFLVLFFVFRDKAGFGHFPWFFWLGLAVGLAQNVCVLFPRMLYRMGLKRYSKRQQAKIEDDSNLGDITNS